MSAGNSKTVLDLPGYEQIQIRELVMFAPHCMVPQLGMMIPQGNVFVPMSSLQPKQAKPKGKKPTVQQNETHRAGDWVCILCNNLNYSFRKVCNRCQTQTKRDNLIQSLQLLQSPGFSMAASGVGLSSVSFPPCTYTSAEEELAVLQSATWGVPNSSNWVAPDIRSHLPPGLEAPSLQQTQNSSQQVLEYSASSKPTGTSKPLQDGSQQFPRLEDTMQPQSQQPLGEKRQPIKPKEGSSSRDSLHSSASTQSSRGTQSGEKTCLQESGRNQASNESQALYSLFCANSTGRKREGSGDATEVSVPAGKHAIGHIVDRFEDDEDDQADYVLRACFDASHSVSSSKSQGQSIQHLTQVSHGEADHQEDFSKCVVGSTSEQCSFNNWRTRAEQESLDLPNTSYTSVTVLRNLDFVLGSE